MILPEKRKKMKAMINRRGLFVKNLMSECYYNCINFCMNKISREKMQ